MIAGANGPIAPGETARFTVAVDGRNSQNTFLNYAAMLLPSNDFFLANGNERAHPIFDAQGNFIGADFIEFGRDVLDAGTEVNDEVPANTAFFGQQAPNTGVSENGVIRLAEGFIPGGSILSDPRFANGDFTAEGYQVVRIRVFNTISGDDKNDDLLGTRQDDLIIGNGGNDRILGLRGNDNLEGGAGDDILRGGEGNDILQGGMGFDRLAGGRGEDIFVLAAGAGSSTIVDFGVGDRFRLTSLQFADLTIEQSRSNTVIRSGVDELAVLRNTNASSITDSLFA